MSAFRERQTLAQRAEQNSVKSVETERPPCRNLSRSDCRTVAHLTGTTYTVVDGGPTGSTESVTDHWATYDYSVKMPPAPVEVYHPQTSPYGRVPGEVAAEQTLEQLRQSAAKREHEERLAEERRAARERRPRR